MFGACRPSAHINFGITFKPLPPYAQRLMMVTSQYALVTTSRHFLTSQQHPSFILVLAHGRQLHTFERFEFFKNFPAFFF